MKIECTELLSRPDNIEVLRNQIGLLLATELKNQHKLAIEAGAADKADYAVSVYIENDDPIQFVDAGENPFPLVNVTLENVERERGSSSINKHKMSASFLLDVYAIGNVDAGNLPATENASIKAWKAARLVRNILCAENYAYLGLRGIVEGRDLTRFEAGSPATASAVLRVKIVRISLSVDYWEGVAMNDGEELEAIAAKLIDQNGKVLAEF